MLCTLCIVLYALCLLHCVLCIFTQYILYVHCVLPTCAILCHCVHCLVLPEHSDLWTMYHGIIFCPRHASTCCIHYMCTVYNMYVCMYVCTHTLYVHWSDVPPPVPPVLRAGAEENTPQFRQAADPAAPPFLPFLFVGRTKMTKCPHPPRLVELTKWPNFPGYGFNLHAEKARQGEKTFCRI